MPSTPLDHQYRIGGRQGDKRQTHDITHNERSPLIVDGVYNGRIWRKGEANGFEERRVRRNPSILRQQAPKDRKRKGKPYEAKRYSEWNKKKRPILVAAQLRPFWPSWRSAPTTQSRDRSRSSRPPKARAWKPRRAWTTWLEQWGEPTVRPRARQASRLTSRPLDGAATTIRADGWPARRTWR